MRIVKSLAIAATLAAACGAARAVTVGADGVPELEVCMEELNGAPLFYADRDGSVPILIKMAAREAGIRVRIHRAPFLRCMAEVRAGVADAYPTVGWSKEGAQVFLYPGTPGAPDPAFASLSMRVMVYRRAGDKVQWNGQAFSGLARPVLVERGNLLAQERLARLGVRKESSARDSEANLAKLLAARGDAVVSYELAASPLLDKPRFAGRIDMLPKPFVTEQYYFGVGRAAYAGHRAAVEGMWRAIARVRQSPEYAAALRALPTR